VDRGSAVIEGVAAIAVSFLLLTLLVQIGAAMAAREAAHSAVAAAARRAARPGADPGAEAERLIGRLDAVIPGAGPVTAAVERAGSEATAVARFRWIPPGPDWIPVTIEVDAAAALVVPP
jgi:hypothetical protein